MDWYRRTACGRVRGINLRVARPLHVHVLSRHGYRNGVQVLDSSLELIHPDMQERSYYGNGSKSKIQLLSVSLGDTVYPCFWNSTNQRLARRLRLYSATTSYIFLYMRMPILRRARSSGEFHNIICTEASVITMGSGGSSTNGTMV